jgi:hypothetical protein
MQKGRRGNTTVAGPKPKKSGMGYESIATDKDNHTFYIG